MIELQGVLLFCVLLFSSFGTLVASTGGSDAIHRGDIKQYKSDNM